MDIELEKRIKEENQKLHDFGAKNYDNYPPYCIKKIKKIFLSDAKFIKGILKKKSVKLLDGGCGTGDLAISFINAGFDNLELLDISQQMIRVAKQKIINKRGIKINYYTGDIDGFLLKNKKKYDLICFTSVLHHIGDYFQTLDLTIKKLNPRGVIYILDSQLSKKHKNLMVRFVDFMAKVSINFYKAVSNPKYALKFLIGSKSKKIDIALAEFHAEKGIDEKKIINFMKSKKLEVKKYSTCIGWPFKFFELFNFLKKHKSQTFTLIFQK